MVQTFGVNSARDIYLGADGNIVILSGLNAIIDACASATRAQLGEMVLATKQGIPNFQTIWAGVPNYKIWESYLRTTLLNVAGVLDVTNVTLRSQNNKFTYTATIKTQYGNTLITG